MRTWLLSIWQRPLMLALALSVMLPLAAAKSNGDISQRLCCQRKNLPPSIGSEDLGCRV
jgi:hypothetical protein